MITQESKIDIQKIQKKDGRKGNGKHPNSHKTNIKKKGVKHELTIVKDQIRQMELADVQVSIKNMARKLLNSQAIAALGTHKMIIITKDSEGTHVETVRDEQRMTLLLEEGIYGKDYWIVAGAEPDWKAAEALLNRAGLKPKDSAAPGGLSIYQLILQAKGNANNS